MTSETIADGAPEEGPADAELIERARRGDTDAFGRLIRRYQRRVFAVAFRMVRNRADAEDLVQETFLRAWRSIDRFDTERPFAPWIYRIATNRALSALESRKRHEGDELTESIPWSGPSPERDTERRRLAERVTRAMGALPDEQRAVLALRAGEGLSYREISEALGIPVGTVMSRLARARDAMRREVDR